MREGLVKEACCHDGRSDKVCVCVCVWPLVQYNVGGIRIFICTEMGQVEVKQEGPYDGGSEGTIFLRQWCGSDQKGRGGDSVSCFMSFLFCLFSFC